MAEELKTASDINDELPVMKKVKCMGKKQDARRRFLYGEEKCGQPYLRIVHNEDKAGELDKVAAKTECPVCGSEEYDQITKYTVSDNGLRVTIKKNEVW